jgi:hypothetical protein
MMAVPLQPAATARIRAPTKQADDAISRARLDASSPLSPRSFEPLRVRIPLLAEPFELGRAFLRCSPLDPRSSDPSTSSLRLPLRFILVCGSECQGSLLQHHCRRSGAVLVLGVTSSTSRKPLPDLADRLSDIPNGKKASRQLRPDIRDSDYSAMVRWRS